MKKFVICNCKRSHLPTSQVPKLTLAVNQTHGPALTAPTTELQSPSNYTCPNNLLRAVKVVMNLSTSHLVAAWCMCAVMTSCSRSICTQFPCVGLDWHCASNQQFTVASSCHCMTRSLTMYHSEKCDEGCCSLTSS